MQVPVWTGTGTLRLEINVCTAGVLKTCTQRGEYLVKPGDGILVNANVLHRNEAFEGATGVRAQTHMFDRGMLAAAEQPLRRYVTPVVECVLLDALPLSRADAAQREILDLLSRVFAAAGEEADGYELEILRAADADMAGRLCARAAPAWRPSARAPAGDGSP